MCVGTGTLWEPFFFVLYTESTGLLFEKGWLLSFAGFLGLGLG